MALACELPLLARTERFAYLLGGLGCWLRSAGTYR